MEGTPQANEIKAVQQDSCSFGPAEILGFLKHCYTDNNSEPVLRRLAHPGAAPLQLLIGKSRGCHGALLLSSLGAPAIGSATLSAKSWSLSAKGCWRLLYRRHVMRTVNSFARSAISGVESALALELSV